jgi:hypothetical protein
VIQRNGDFRRGDNTHTHAQIVGAETNLLIQAKVRKMAVENVFESAGALVQRTVLDNVDSQAPNPKFPSINSLVSSVSDNCLRNNQVFHSYLSVLNSNL